MRLTSEKALEMLKFFKNQGEDTGGISHPICDGDKMIKVGKKENNIDYYERRSSYGIVQNNDGKIAVVYHENWGLIFPGGKMELGETSDETIKRESLEEIGYQVDKLKYYATTDSYYKVDVKKKGIVYCHNVADFYIGIIKDKIQEPIELDTSIRWYFPNELLGKMKLEFQNIILEKLYNEKRL